jgi:hypothetical protein
MPRKDQEPPRPLNRQEERFITAFLRTRDIYKAAEKAGIAKNQAVKTFNKIEIQEEIERQKDVLRQETARQEAEIVLLTGEWLDGQLRRVICEEKGSTATDAIRLGYVAIGRIQAGQTRVLDPGGFGGAESVATPANFYQALVPATVTITPIMPEPTPATVPQAAAPHPETTRTAYKPPSAARADDETVKARIAALNSKPQPPIVAPPSKTPVKRAARLIIE